MAVQEKHNAPNPAKINIPTEPQFPSPYISKNAKKMLSRS